MTWCHFQRLLNTLCKIHPARVIHSLEVASHLRYEVQATLNWGCFTFEIKFGWSTRPPKFYRPILDGIWRAFQVSTAYREILSNQTEINQGMMNTIWFLFYSIRFLKDFFVCIFQMRMLQVSHKIYLTALVSRKTISCKTFIFPQHLLSACTLATAKISFLPTTFPRHTFFCRTSDAPSFLMVFCLVHSPTKSVPNL